MEPYCFKNITYTYPGQEKPALSDVSFTVGRGEFIIVCGASGSGKTTLLRQLKETNPEFGFVMQNPETQIVTDRVCHELAFGMESMGVPTERMWRAIAETATYFGMEDWMERDTRSLSGGEMQLVNLASVLVMNPDVILLDEPTARLDPMAAIGLIEVVKRLNTQTGVTVIMIEQSLEEVLAVCDRMLVLHEGHVAAYGSVADVYAKICRLELSAQYFSYMPAYVRLYERVNREKNQEDVPAGICPQSIKECRKWFYENEISLPVRETRVERPGDEYSVACSDVFFRYERTGEDVLKGVRYRICPGHVYGIAGGNGGGKSTFLKLLAGAKRPYYGKIKVSGRTAYMPQEPRYMFVQDTVGDIVTDPRAVEKFGLESVLDHHPYDVSGGQMQRLAMAYLYEQEAEVYLFDEPTKGLDPEWKRVFGRWLEELAAAGKTVLVVTHDVEFAANYCGWMSMCFHAELSEPEPTPEFFRGHYFYTTAFHKIVRDRYPNAVSERSLHEG